MSEYCIEASHMGKTYLLSKGRGKKEAFRALEDLSFRVRKGEWIGVIGLNGSGKSTLLKLLAGVSVPDTGSLAVRGTRSAILELGAGFHPDYTGWENVRLQLLLQGITGRKAGDMARKIADFAETGPFMDQCVRFYSTGMFMRLAFSCMVCSCPDLLLVDEALSVGDIFFRQKCLGRMKEMSEKAAIVLVTHDMEAAVRFCSRILVLDRGRLVWDGDPAEAVTRFIQIRQGGPRPAAPFSEKAGQIFSRGGPLMHVPDPESLSGKMEFVIKAYGWETDHIPDGGFCRRGTRIRVFMDIFLSRDPEGLIIGYQILNRLGMEVFGETSLHALSGDVKEAAFCRAGFFRVTFSFTWPQIRDGDYFMTLGLGEGREVLGQTEQCWVNRAVHFQSDPGGEVIHGIFNRRMENLTIRREDADVDIF